MIEDRNTPIDYINRDIVSVKDQIAVLSKLVRDGNGQPSLIQQTATLGNEISHLKVDLQKEIFELKTMVGDCHRNSQAKDRLSWHSKTAIWVALISSITSIFLHYIK
jgi:hypothetical protein